MGTKRAAGLLVTVPRVGKRRRGIKLILRALVASRVRQERVEAAREGERVENAVFRRVWGKG